MKNAALSEKPYAGNPHVRFDEGEVASAKPRRGSLLYKNRDWSVGLNNDHWYRFRAVVHPQLGTYDLAVYDQGDIQPTVPSADGTLFALADDIPFVDPSTSGVSSISVSAAGVGSTYGNVEDDSACALLDNLRMEWNRGMQILFR